jgi:hypothetical protein
MPPPIEFSRNQPGHARKLFLAAAHFTRDRHNQKTQKTETQYLAMSITCTFPDGKSHTIDHTTNHSADSIRRALATLTPYEPEAIQLFTTEGAGRELTADNNIVPPGSELHAVGHDLQFERKAQLQNALANGDGAGYWCTIMVCREQAHRPEDSTVGALLRLARTNADLFAFVSEDYTVQLKGTYLLHKDQFRVKWVRDGKNNAGIMLLGDELEATLQWSFLCEM